MSHNRRSRYSPGVPIRSRPHLLRAIDYYLTTEGPLHTKQLYKRLKSDIQIKDMDTKHMAILMGKSGLFQTVSKDPETGFLWTNPW